MYDQLENPNGWMGEGSDALVNAVAVWGGEPIVAVAFVAACVVVAVWSSSIEEET